VTVTTESKKKIEGGKWNHFKRKIFDQRIWCWLR